MKESITQSILVFCLAAVILGLAQAESDTSMNSSEKDRHFMQRLAEKNLSAEQRAIRIEKWQESQNATSGASRPITPILPSVVSIHVAAQTVSPAKLKVPIPEAQLLADIQETEAEIRSIYRSIETAHSTPEQRAIQIEQFIHLNREPFAQLQQLKREAAALSKAEEISSRPPPAGVVPMSEKTSHLKAEIDRFMHDLSQIDPETRARHLESHAAALQAMSDKLLKSLSPSTSTNLNTPDAP